MKDQITHLWHAFQDAHPVIRSQFWLAFALTALQWVLLMLAFLTESDRFNAFRIVLGPAGSGQVAFYLLAPLFLLPKGRPRTRMFVWFFFTIHLVLEFVRAVFIYDQPSMFAPPSYWWIIMVAFFLIFVASLYLPSVSRFLSQAAEAHE